jgi:predicted Zn-dependent protease with MMP-like domain
VILRVDDFPDAEVEAEMGLESPFDLLGLYHGVALPNQSVMDGVPHVPMVFLYRRPILDYWWSVLMKKTSNNNKNGQFLIKSLPNS